MTILDHSVSAQLPQIIRKRWNRYVNTFDLLRRNGLGVEAVHDFRVATRRMISCLRLAELLEHPEEIRLLRRGMKKMFDEFSQLRDMQVQKALAQPLSKDYPAVQRFVRHLSRREKWRTRLLESALDRNEMKQDQTDIGKIIGQRESADDEYSAGKTLNRVVAVQYEDRLYAVTRRFDAIEPVEAQTIHRLRVAFKKYRYFLEIAAELFPESGIEKLLPDARWYQTEMGEIQDLDVLRCGIEAFSNRVKGEREDLRNAGDWIAAREKKAIEVFWKKRGAFAGFFQCAATWMPPASSSTIPPPLPRHGDDLVERVRRGAAGADRGGGGI